MQTVNFPVKDDFADTSQHEMLTQASDIEIFMSTKYAVSAHIHSPHMNQENQDWQGKPQEEHEPLGFHRNMLRMPGGPVEESV